MELFALYLQFLSEICEGTRPAPAGITVPASGAEEKVQAVQQAALSFAHFTGIVPDAALCRDILQELEAAQ